MGKIKPRAGSSNSLSVYSLQKRQQLGCQGGLSSELGSHRWLQQELRTLLARTGKLLMPEKNPLPLKASSTLPLAPPWSSTGCSAFWSSQEGNPPTPAGSELVKMSRLQPCFSLLLINGAGSSSPRNPRSHTALHKGSILPSILPPERGGADPPRGPRHEQGLRCFPPDSAASGSFG